MEFEGSVLLRCQCSSNLFIDSMKFDPKYYQALFQWKMTTNSKIHSKIKDLGQSRQSQNKAGKFSQRDCKSFYKANNNNIKKWGYWHTDKYILQQNRIKSWKYWSIC